jgi:hypothetical protein
MRCGKLNINEVINRRNNSMFWTTVLEIHFQFNNHNYVAESIQLRTKLKLIPKNFAEAYQKVISISKVPVILPQKSSAYARVLSSDVDSYFIIIGFSKNCGGGNACRIGSIKGEKINSFIPTLSELKKLSDIRKEGLFYPSDISQYSLLSNGVKGVYLPFSCGANCSDGKIVWESNGFRYTIGIKAANLKSVVSFANEVIENME